jgi:hypothetical protein
MPDVTRILAAIEQDFPGAAEQLLTLEHDKLRTLVAAKLACEKLGQTRDATGLVHEAYIRLVERACQKQSRERGGDFQRLDLDAVEPVVLPIGCDDLLGVSGMAICVPTRIDRATQEKNSTDGKAGARMSREVSSEL